MLKKTVIFCALMLIVSFNAFAHDVWVEKKDGKFFIVYGHGEKHDPYDPSKIKEVIAYDSNGNPTPVEVIRHKDSASLSTKERVSAFTIFFDNGYWVKTTEAWRNISKIEAEAKGMQLVEPARHSLKYAKSLIQWAEIYTKPLGMKLEVVPASNPLLMKKGESLSVTVFYEGRPLEGARIESGYIGHHEIAKTDKKGVAVIPVKSGMNVIVAKHSVPIKDNPHVDIISISSTLTFEVK